MTNWKGLSLNFRLWRNRWVYPVVSGMVALSLIMSTFLPAKALDFLPLLLQGVQVFQLSNISERQEVELGKQMNQQLSQEIRFYRNPEVNSYVQKIGQRLAAHSTRPNIPYTFQIVDDNAINAFATTGGFVYINKGLLKAADDEAEVASVLGHEMGHIEGKHLLKQMRQKALESGIAAATGLNRSQAVGLGVNLALNLPRSRQDEYDADKRGLKTLTNTGYAQTAMVSFMQKLLGKSSAPAFLSTHPDTGARINALNNQISNQPSSNSYGLDTSGYDTHIRKFLR